MMTITLHPLADSDWDDWRALYRGYADFYRQPMTDAILAQNRRWLQDGMLHGVIARAGGGEAAGLAHWEFMMRPLRGAPLAYLHDLFVAPAHRRAGVGSALLAHVRAAAAAQGCQTLRWLTKADNAAARRLYDKTAVAAAEWVMYQQSAQTP